MPIPVDPEIDSMVRRGAEATGLKLADIMRQGLRHGVPAFVERLRIVSEERPAACLSYLDDYPPAFIQAKNCKTALKAKISKKYVRPNS